MFKPKKKELKFSDVKSPKEVIDRSVTKEDEKLEVPVPEKEKEESLEVKQQARIVSARIIEGMVIETIINSNYSLGEVGDYFEN